MVAEAEGLRAQLGLKLSALEHLDATIRVFKPDIDCADLPERPAFPLNAAIRGDVQRYFLDILRNADAPMTTLELAEASMRKRGLDPADRMLFKLIARRAGHSLAKLRASGKVESQKVGGTMALRWSLVR
jgi:hypothetical protein